MPASHVPVLAPEAVALLAAERGGWFVDATVGPGGHAAAILAASPAVRLLGIDRDPEALAEARRNLAGEAGRLELVEGDFADLERLLGERGRSGVAGILADLGVSSQQLDRPERGFSFRREGPLDMRMGRSEMSAADVIAQYSEAELERIFRELGEERQARRVARAIVAARSARPVVTTSALREVIERAKGVARGVKEGRVDPATRVFQALRIEVNQELAALERFLDQAVRMLQQDGRLVIISYHSLEDRLVKNRFRDLGRGEVHPVTGRPLAETRVLEVLTRKPVRPGAAEIAANPRARSARLRAARRL